MTSGFIHASFVKIVKGHNPQGTEIFSPMEVPAVPAAPPGPPRVRSRGT